MTHSIVAHFDGKVIVPDEPVKLPVGQPLRIHVNPDPDAELVEAVLGRLAGADERRLKQLSLLSRIRG